MGCEPIVGSTAGGCSVASARSLGTGLHKPCWCVFGKAA